MLPTHRPLWNETGPVREYRCFVSLLKANETFVKNKIIGCVLCKSLFSYLYNIVEQIERCLAYSAVNMSDFGGSTSLVVRKVRIAGLYLAARIRRATGTSTIRIKRDESVTWQNFLTLSHCPNCIPRWWWRACSPSFCYRRRVPLYYGSVFCWPLTICVSSVS